MEDSVAEKSADPGFDRLRLQFEEYADASISARAKSERCRAYRDGDQLSEQEIATLRKRGQPPVIDNKIADKVDTLSGIEEQTRTDPKAYPRTPEHQEASEVATDALRFIADDSVFVDHCAAAHENFVVEGLCGGEVIAEKRKGKPPAIRMKRIRWDRIFYDPHSLELDYSDSGYKGYDTWMDYEQAKRDWDPKRNKHAAEDALANLEQCFVDTGTVGIADTHDDKPRYIMTTRGRKRVQVFTHYFLEDGEWKYAVWCRGGYLEEPRPSPYKDEEGEPSCGMELQAVYKDSDGNPYGVVQRYLDLQDAHNKRHSKMLHLLNTKQIIAEQGAVTDVNRAREQLHRPDGVIEHTPGLKFDIHNNLDMAQGQFLLLRWTDAQLGATGPNDALQGQSGSISGRAKQLDQQAGTLLLGPLRKAHRSWKLRMYRQAWNRARQFWKAEMWIRVTDDEDKVKFVGLNQPVLQGDLMAEQLRSAQLPPEQMAAKLEMIASDPASREPAIENGRAKIKNAVAEMDVDIIIDESPDTVTVQQEQFETLVTLAERRPEVPFDVLVDLSQLRSEVKKRVMDRLTGQNDPAAQQRAQFQEMMQQLQTALLEAQVRRENASAAKDEANAAESGIDQAIKIANAEEPMERQLRVS